MSNARLIAVRVPGVGRLRFTRSDITNLTMGDWVAFPWTWGREAGLVAFLSNLPPEQHDLPPIDHRLAATDVERVIERAEQARRAIPLAVEIFGQLAPELLVSGLRYTLNGDIAVLSGQIPDSMDLSALLGSLGQSIGTTVHFEPDGEEGHLFGGMGRMTPDSANTSLETLFQSRLPLERLHQNLAPAGLPRIGASVSVGGGSGRVVSISTKRREATVEMVDGSERLIPLTALTIHTDD